MSRLAGALRRRIDRRTVWSLATGAVWQLANYAIPLATFPYLARILGVRGFGLLAIAAATANYALLVTDWGFNLTATQAVAQSRADFAAVNRIVWTTITAKAMLAILSCTLVLGLTQVFVQDPSIRAVVLITLVSVLASVFTLDWALRGVERIRSFAIASVLGRLVSIPATFILVRHADDVGFAALSGALGSLAVSALTMAFGVRFGLVGRPTFDIRASLAQIKEGLHVFISMAAVSLYTNFLALVLGWTSGPTEVGLFNGADRIRRPVQGLLSPIELVFYPRISGLAVSDHQAAARLARTILVLQSAFSLALSAVLFVVAPEAVRLVLGTGFGGSVSVLRVLSGIVFLIGVNNVLGLMILLPFGMRRQFTVCTLIGAALGAGLAVPLSLRFGAIGTASAAMAAEFCVVATMLFAARGMLTRTPVAHGAAG